MDSTKKLSRRNFCKTCLAMAGGVALGGIGIACRANSQTRENETHADTRAYRPRYLNHEATGELEKVERALFEMMSPCTLCPRNCGVNRAAGRTALCNTAQNFKVASHGPHFGEERIFVGSGGSGTIFFSNCNLLCIFCLNWQINHRGDGRETTAEELANMMLALQKRGCSNINLVTPSHILPHAISGLRIAISKGLSIPLLYNCSGYESLEVIKLLDGVVDIYMPDFKYQDAQVAARFSQGASDYPEVAAAAIKEMHRQVGDIKLSQSGTATSGLLIRHLVMPENLAGTDKFVEWVANELGRDTHVNIMGQYTPKYRADEFPPLDRRITQQEFALAMQQARDAGLHNFH